MNTLTNRERFLAKELFYHKALPGKLLQYAHFGKKYYLKLDDKYYCTVTRITDAGFEVVHQLFHHKNEAVIAFSELTFN